MDAWITQSCYHPDRLGRPPFDQVFKYGLAAPAGWRSPISTGSDAGGLRVPQGLNGYAPHWSPDGTKIVYQLRNGASDPPDLGNVFVHDLSSGQTTQLTDLELSAAGWWFMSPRFSPDGREVIFPPAPGLVRDHEVRPVVGARDGRRARVGAAERALPHGPTEREGDRDRHAEWRRSHR